MNNKLKLSIALLLGIISIMPSYAAVVNMWKSVWWGGKISELSTSTLAWWSSLEKINNAWLSVLHTAKVALSGVFLIYLVYLGFQMIMAMWDDGKLSSAKKQIYYTLVGFMFINIPGSLYDVFSWKNNNDVTAKTTYKEVVVNNSDSNMFVNFFNWNSTVENWIISFIKVIVITVVIMLFMMAAIWLVSSGWNDEKRKKAKTRFINWILWLIFIWVIQSWTYVAYSWDIPKCQSLFANISNVAIFFAAPVAIFFLIMWWFWYITSAWDEAKAKKWIAIIKNTFVAVIILLASYAFLKDLADFTL